MDLRAEGTQVTEVHRCVVKPNLSGKSTGLCFVEMIRIGQWSLRVGLD